jgi:predicted O-methyltransferase YrrM
MALEETVPETIEAYAAAIGPGTDELIDEMGAQAESEGFPYVGPAVGGWLAMCARFADAERVFEFGSGFGYSAYWFARALPADGEVVLTEVDADELDQAREYMARGGYDDIATYELGDEDELDDAREYFERADVDPTPRFELGDAIETIEAYDGPFDVVLVDNEKDRYAEAFESVRDKVAPGGIVAADNATAGGSIDAEALRAHFEGEAVDLDSMSAGIAEYVETVRADPEFETVLLPLGEGVAVSQRQH